MASDVNGFKFCNFDELKKVSVIRLELYTDQAWKVH
jgi:hypothetical protein